MKNTIKINEKFTVRKFSLALSLLLASFQLIAQDEQPVPEASDKQPARPAFQSALLIDMQSSVVPTKGTLEFDIQHRFGTVENGISDLYGIYAPGANIRMGFTYAPIENLSVGLGYAKLKSYLDFTAKYAILKQRKDWSIPVSLTYYGNMAIDTREQDTHEFDKPVHRLCFQNELIIASRLSSKLSLQLTPSYSHFNAVDSLNSSEVSGAYTNDVIGLTVAGRYKFTAQSSVVFSYAQQLTSHDDLEGFDLKPGVALGWEIATSSHVFQIFVTNFQGIIPQENMVFNTNDFFEGDLMIGFNITRLWNF